MVDSKIIVFLGPSLPLNLAKQLLPQALYLPPVRCGDIFTALRLQPTTIAIIDGVFENTAAIWHKEILFALEKGVTVYGASSMGALRAAELADLGMHGVGVIFNKFYQGEYNDDDEVAVLHGAFGDYAAINEPMVNIRATLEAALQQQIIDTRTAELITNAAKKLFYRDRALTTACEIALKHGATSETITKLQHWLDNDNYIDQKRLDAIELLQQLSQTTQPPNNCKVNRSIFIRTLQKNSMCRPFNCNNKNLPNSEQVAMAARLLNSDYRLLKILANSLATFDALATTHPKTSTTKIILNLLPKGISTQAWEELNDCSASEKVKLIERLTRIQQYANSFLDTETKLEPYRSYLKYLLSLPKPQLQTLTTIEIIATLWAALTKIVPETLPTVAAIQAQADQFRREHQLYTPELTEQWFKNHNLNLEQFQEFIIELARFNFVVIRNNLDILKSCRYGEESCWLLDALRLTEFYPIAKRITSNDSYRNELLTSLRADFSESLAFSLDFSRTEQDQLFFLP